MDETVATYVLRLEAALVVGAVARDARARGGRGAVGRLLLGTEKINGDGRDLIRGDGSIRCRLQECE